MQDFVKSEQPPTQTQIFQLVRDINMYARDDFESLSVKVDAVVEVMTNFYQYECT
mgnify:CR=1 FL=1